MNMDAESRRLLIKEAAERHAYMRDNGLPIPTELPMPAPMPLPTPVADLLAQCIAKAGGAIKLAKLLDKHASRVSQLRLRGLTPEYETALSAYLATGVMPRVGKKLKTSAKAKGERPVPGPRQRICPPPLGRDAVLLRAARLLRASGELWLATEVLGITLDLSETK